LNDATRPLLTRADSGAAVLTANGALVTSKSFFEAFDSGAYEEPTNVRAA